MTEDVALEQSDLDWCLVITKYAIPTVNELVQKIGPISLRTLHYNLVSREIIPNTRSGYNTLSKYIVKARKEGRFSWDNIIDETRHSIADFHDFYISPEKYVHGLLYRLGELHNDYEEEILYKWYKRAILCCGLVRKECACWSLQEVFRRQTRKTGSKKGLWVMDLCIRKLQKTV